MQVNRLSHLIFPPVTPSVSGGLPGAADMGAEANDIAAGSDRAAAQGAPVRAQRAAAVPRAPEATPQKASEASVKLDLDHSQRAQAPVTYGPDGMFAGKSSIEVANTPAERFVASAVGIMRAYEQEHAQPVALGTLERLKQAVVSRFSAQA